MNKKFKVVSSLALAGMMALNSFSLNKTFAADANDIIKTNPVGVYRELVEGKTVAPFVLLGTNDVVSVKEITGSEEFGKVTKFNNTDISVVNPELHVKTGDTFVAGEETFTVIIYGDVNKDGRVNAKDATLIDEYSVEISTLDEIQMEAADVDINDGNVNAKDSTAIKEFSVESRDTVISNLPKKDVVGVHKVSFIDNKFDNPTEQIETDENGIISTPKDLVIHWMDIRF